jgi:acylphosphatase
MIVARHVVFHGRVQGVGFRAHVERVALTRDIEGWVRNRREGNVEAVFAGPGEAVRAAIEACREGPPAARVEKTDMRDATSEERAQCRPGERFSVLPTI